jgi:hypothetical protein
MIEWVWSIGGMILTGESEVLGEKPVLVPLCPPQILQGLVMDWTWTSMVWGRWLTAWVMTQPYVMLSDKQLTSVLKDHTSSLLWRWKLCIPVMWRYFTVNMVRRLESLPTRWWEPIDMHLLWRNSVVVAVYVCPVSSALPFLSNWQTIWLSDTLWYISKQICSFWWTKILWSYLQGYDVLWMTKCRRESEQSCKE